MAAANHGAPVPEEEDTGRRRARGYRVGEKFRTSVSRLSMQPKRFKWSLRKHRQKLVVVIPVHSVRGEAGGCVGTLVHPLITHRSATAEGRGASSGVIGVILSCCGSRRVVDESFVVCMFVTLGKKSLLLESIQD